MKLNKAAFNNLHSYFIILNDACTNGIMNEDKKENS